MSKKGFLRKRILRLGEGFVEGGSGPFEIELPDQHAQSTYDLQKKRSDYKPQA